MQLFKYFCAALILAAGILHAQPKISLDEKEVVLGSVYNGMKATGRISYKNIGNDTLKILSVQPSCGCTTIQPPKTVLPPGASDVIEVQFNSTGYRGRVEKYVQITTNDPTSQFLSVKLLTEVKEVLQPVNGSSMIWFNNAVIGKPITQSYSLKNVSGTTLVIYRDSVSLSNLQVTMNKKMLTPGETVDLQLTVVPEKAGFTEGHVYLVTNHAMQPLVDIRVTYLGTKGN